MQLKRILPLFLLICTCPAWSQTNLKLDQTRSISRSVFEVVIEKSDSDEIKYEEELPRELIPYQERIDPYDSIGTAFAVGKNLFLSAAHVFSPENRTIQQNISLRDTSGTIYPVRRIFKYDNQKDFILFTVEGLDNSQWLELSGVVEINEYVYAVGNAYGEGIIFRNGLLTSLTPEKEKGAWRWLRYSAAASPGNSGGPLLNQDGKVIGIVTAKSQNENLNYGLPVTEVGNLEPGPGLLHESMTYQIPNINYKFRDIFNYSIALPQDYEDLQEELNADQEEIFRKSIQGLKEYYQNEIFPFDKGSEELLTATTATLFPYIINEKDDSTWQLSKPKDIYTSEYSGGGYLKTGNIWDDTFWQLELPEGESVWDYFETPRKLMDLYLAGNKITRKVGSADIRITSYGEPEEAEWFSDKWGRQWLRTVWLLPFADCEVIMYALPTPSGAVGISNIVRTSQAYTYDLDFKVMLNFIYVSFFADFNQWTAYLANPERTARIFDSINFQYTIGETARFNSDSLNVVYDGSLIGISDKSRLFMVTGFCKNRDSYTWDISRLFFYESDVSANYFALEKKYRPIDPHDSDKMEDWNNVVGQKYPFDRDPICTKGKTYIHDTRNIQNGKETDPSLNYLWTYYLSREGEWEDEEILPLFMKLDSGFSLTELEKQRALYGTGLDYIEQQSLSRVNGINIFQAISTDEQEIFSYLVEKGVNLDARNGEGKTPLMVALEMEQQQKAEKLIEAGVELNISDTDGNTPLLLSLRQMPESTAEIILKEGADPAMKDNNGYTPLMEAARSEYAEIAMKIAMMGVPVDPVNSNGRSALYYALCSGLDELAIKLMKMGAPASLDENANYSMLMMALKYTSEETSRYLIQKGTLLNGCTAKGWTPLLYALRYGKSEIAAYLLRKEKDVNYADENGWSPLHMSVRYSTLENVKALMDAGADIELRTGNNNTNILSLSFYNDENPDITDYLLNQDIPIDETAKDGWTTLMTALRYGTEEQAWQIFKSSGNHSGRTDEGWTPVMFAVRYDHPEIARELINSGCPVNEKNKDNFTALHLAAGNSDLETVRALVEHGADITLLNTDNKTPLMQAIRNGKEKIASYLLEKGSALDTISQTDWTPLMLAIRYSSPELVKELIRCGAPIGNSATADGWNDFLLAARNSTEEICRLMIDNGADFRQKNNANYTALHFAAQYNEGVVNLLIENGLKLNDQNSSGRTPLHQAVEGKNLQSVKILLQAGARRDVTDKDGKTPEDLIDRENTAILSLFQ